MTDKTRDQLIAENLELRRRVAAMQSVEAELRHSEAKWRSVAETAPVFVSVVDQSGTMQFLNRFRAGFEPATVLGRAIYDFIQPQYHSVARQCLERVFKTGEGASYESVGTGSDGSMSDYVTDVGPVIVDGEIIAATLISRDTTDHKRAEKALRESEERYRLLAECIPHPVWRSDAEGMQIDCNRRWQEYTGQTPEEAQGKGWMKALHPDDVPRAVERVREDVPSGKVYQAEYRLHRASDDSYHWYLARAIPRRDANGTILGWFGCAIDIDDQKRAEEELVKSKAILQATIDCLPFNFFAIGSDGRYILQNAVSRQQAGDVIGKRPEEVCPNKDDLAIWLDNNRRAFAGEKVEGEVSLTLTDERRFYYNVVAPIWVEEESFGILGVNIDITERKRAEEALKKARDELEQRVEERTAELNEANLQLRREVDERRRAEEALRRSEERLRLAQQVARVGTFEWNVQTGHNTWTPELEALYGLSAGGFPGTQSAFENLVYCDDRAGIIRRAEQALETGEPTEGEWRVAWPDGSVHWLAGRWQAFKDECGEPLRMIGVNIDITERKRDQEALRASTERYELAVRGAGVGIWDWDIRTGKVYYSPRWKMLFGYDENDIGDSVDDWARLLHPDERDWILKFQDDFLAGTSPTVTVEYRLRHKDGSYRWIVAHGLAVRDEEGRAYRLVGSHGDITARKRAEEALERERQSLWRMLQASDHERQLIAYDIHDGLTQYLARATMQFQAHDSLQEDSPKKARKAYETALELVRQAHSEARRLINEVRPPVIDDNGLETAISHLVHEQRRRGGPKIECHSNVQFGRLPSILENALYRIVQEALTNACKHSESTNVAVTMTQEGQDVRLEVRDWGIGFDPQSVERGHFGLEGIRQRVRLLGGTLTIESTPGSGTLVQVVVPIVERQNEE